MKLLNLHQLLCCIYCHVGFSAVLSLLNCDVTMDSSWHVIMSSEKQSHVVVALVCTLCSPFCFATADCKLLQNAVHLF